MQQDVSAREGLLKLSYAESQDLTTRSRRELKSNIEAQQSSVYLTPKDTLEAMATAALSLLKNESPTILNTALEYVTVSTEDEKNCKDSEAAPADSAATLPEVPMKKRKKIIRQKPAGSVAKRNCSRCARMHVYCNKALPKCARCTSKEVECDYKD